MDKPIPTNSPVVPKKYLVPFAMLVSCFALWGLLNNMTDNLVPAFSKIFMINAGESAAVQISFYGAYAVLAIFASILIEEFSYKTGVLIGLGFYIIGALGYIVAAGCQSFDFFLYAIFILAGGLSVLETTCNPFVLSMGPDDTAVRRLNFAQAFNPIGSLTGIFLAQYFILSHLSDADIDTRKAMDPAIRNEIVNNELFWVCVPYVGLVLIAAVIWFFFMRYKPTDETSLSRKDNLGRKFGRIGLCIVCIIIPLIFQIVCNYQFGIVFGRINQILIMMIGPFACLLLMRDYRELLFKLLRLPRYSFGVIAQFFYVGLQITVWTWTVKYVMAVFPGTQEAAAANYYLCSIVLFIICRATATALMKKFNPANMMALFAIAGILCCLGTMWLPSSLSVWALVAISGCMSLMFPTIYGIALRGLGNEVKLGAAGLIMAILGGAIITPFMGDFIDQQTVSNQVQYFDSINRPVVARAEEADAKKSITSSMLAIYKMSEIPADATGQDKQTRDKFEKNLTTFNTLPTLSGDQFKAAVKTLPGCALISDAEIENLQGNLAKLPSPSDRTEQIRNFTLLPALVSTSPGQSSLISDLVAKPLEMNTFQSQQQQIVESSVRESFFIPVICFAIVLLYAFFFRNAHIKEENEDGAA